MYSIAIYSRKSKFTDKGESIQNQIELCKEYAEKHFNTKNFTIYEDEGYTGSNINRPMFQKLLDDIKNHKIKALICYRLDRISRNISDFSALIELLEKYNVDFVSIREQFDTSTPMGRAMMYITSVFSHLERETIAERIKDNMYQLARTGRWLGGNTPMGYESKPISYHDKEGNSKKMYKLSPIPSQLGIVREIYNKYIQLSSLTQLESWAIENNIKTKNNKNFDKSILKVILTNPVYATADKRIYEYFRKQNANIGNSINEFNGKYGLMVFNKHNEKNNKVIKKDICEWIVAIGNHPGVVTSNDWIKTQNILEVNSKKAPRDGTGKIGLLTELLRCKNCGSKMRVAVYRRKGSTYYYYRCLLKEKSRGNKCTVKNLNGKQADKYVIDKIKNISYEKDDIWDYINKLKNNINHLASFNYCAKLELQKELKEHKEAISNLIFKLSKPMDSTVEKHISIEIKIIDNIIKQIESKIEEIKINEETTKNKQLNITSLLKLINNFPDNIDKLNFDEKKTMLNRIINNIMWDGEKLKINI